MLIINLGNCPTDSSMMGYGDYEANCAAGVPVLNSASSRYAVYQYPGTNLYSVDGTFQEAWGPLNGVNQRYDATSFPQSLEELEKIIRADQPATWEPCDVNSCDQGCDNVYGVASCSCPDGYRLNGDRHTCDKGTLIKNNARGGCLTATASAGLDIVGCDETDDNQIFEFDGATAHIRQVSSGLCVKAEGVFASTPSLVPCDATDEGQTWACDATVQGLIRHSSNMIIIGVNDKTQMYNDNNWGSGTDMAVYFQGLSSTPICAVGDLVPPTAQPTAQPTALPTLDPDAPTTAPPTATPTSRGPSSAGETFAPTASTSEPTMPPSEPSITETNHAPSAAPTAALCLLAAALLNLNHLQ